MATAQALPTKDTIPVETYESNFFSKVWNLLLHRVPVKVFFYYLIAVTAYSRLQKVFLSDVFSNQRLHFRSFCHQFYSA